MDTRNDAPAGTMTVRAYAPSDEASVIRLLEESMGGGPAGRRTVEFFRWKHFDNPFGRSLMLVGQSDGELVGFRTFMRWRFRAGERVLRAARAVDTATLPSWQGRGVFRTLTLAALEELASDTDLIFNTPNEKSLPGYLKMGWRVVGRIPVWIRPRTSIASRAIRTSSSLHDPGRVSPDGDWATDPTEHRIQTDRSIEYATWRYMEAPVPGYGSLALRDGQVFYRLRRRGRFTQATVCDIRASSPRDVRRLLRALGRESGADVLACHAATGTVTHRAVRIAGFARIRGPALVTRPLRPSLDPAPEDLSSWSLSAGDLELF